MYVCMYVCVCVSVFACSFACRKLSLPQPTASSCTLNLKPLTRNLEP